MLTRANTHLCLHRLWSAVRGLEIRAIVHPTRLATAVIMLCDSSSVTPAKVRHEFPRAH
jgi:hypothetical protein